MVPNDTKGKFVDPFGARYHHSTLVTESESDDRSTGNNDLGTAPIPSYSYNAAVSAERRRNIEVAILVEGQTLRTTARAAEKRSANVPVDLVAYEKQKREQMTRFSP
ncbi:MAG: hypothetical protein EBU88_08355 [Acidobacteria bacterium]|nr:hypothetical protein [Acidobacteriota bacterium]